MHAHAIKVSSGADISVCKEVLDIYLKCGMIDEAERLFGEMPARNVISWTFMITGYGKHGLGKKAIRRFNEMQ
jgi:pentatricopeptide repeat protein